MPISEAKLASRAASNTLDDDKRMMYHSIIGSLVYVATRRRPERSVVTAMLASYLRKAMEPDIVAAKRALRYLNGLKIRKSTLKSAENNQISMFVDASWTSSFTKDRKRLYGSRLKFCGVFIAAKTNLYNYVSLSSTEAKYLA